MKKGFSEYTSGNHPEVIGTRHVDIEKEPDEMPVIAVTNAVLQGGPDF
jgi:hypothetical protein